MFYWLILGSEYKWIPACIWNRVGATHALVNSVSHIPSGMHISVDACIVQPINYSINSILFPMEDLPSWAQFDSPSLISALVGWWINHISYGTRACTSTPASAWMMDISFILANKTYTANQSITCSELTGMTPAVVQLRGSTGWANRPFSHFFTRLLHSSLVSVYETRGSF